MKTKLINKISDFFIWASSAEAKDIAKESLVSTLDLLVDRCNDIKPEKKAGIQKALLQDIFFTLPMGMKFASSDESQEVFMSKPLIIGIMGKLSLVENEESLESWVFLLNKINDRYYDAEVLKKILEEFVGLNGRKIIVASDQFEQFRKFFATKIQLLLKIGWSDDLWKPFYDICLEQMKAQLDASSHALGFLLLKSLPEALANTYSDEINKFIEDVDLEEMREFFTKIDLEKFRSNEKLWGAIINRAIVEEIKPGEREEVFEYVYKDIVEVNKRLELIEQLYEKDFNRGFSFITKHISDFIGKHDELYKILMIHWPGVSSGEKTKITKLIATFVKKIDISNIDELIDKVIADLVSDNLDLRKMAVDLYADGTLSFVKVGVMRSKVAKIMEKLIEEQGRPSSILLLKFLLNKKSIIITKSEKNDIKYSLLKVLEISNDSTDMVECLLILKKISRWSWKDQKIQLESIEELTKGDSRESEIKSHLIEALKKIG